MSCQSNYGEFLEQENELIKKHPEWSKHNTIFCMALEEVSKFYLKFFFFDFENIYFCHARRKFTTKNTTFLFNY